MSTTAINSVRKNPGINHQEKPTRQVIREEIKRAQQLEKLEEKYESGEISDFEYKIQKYILKCPEILTLAEPNVLYCNV